MKLCTKCGVEKGLDAFAPNTRSNGSKTRRSGCKTCTNAAAVIWRLTRPGAAARAAARQTFEDLNQRGLKRCSKCGAEKPLDAFSKRSEDDTRRRSFCKVCARPTGAALDRHKAKKYHLRPEHKARQRELATGFTSAMFARVLAHQKGLCAICGKKLLGPGRTQAGSGSKACADHDHATRTPRGILCGRCNSALGLFDDAPERLISAAYYLTKPFIAVSVAART